MTELDQDGDVKMGVPQPIFEYVKAPRLASWSQQALVSYIRERRQYESKIREKCTATGEALDIAKTSVVASMEPMVLEHVANYILQKPLYEVTDDDLVQAMMNKVGSVLNKHVPDITKLFADKVVMELREPDAEARVLSYYVAFDRAVEDNGLGTILGHGPVHDDADRRRMKARCKLLLQGVRPDMLRKEVERLVAVTHQHVKTDDRELFNLLVDRAIQQEHYHTMIKEATDHGSTKAQKGNKGPQQKEKSSSDTPVFNKPAPKAPTAPPHDGCLVCGGPHWLRECPTATETQKVEAVQKFQERKRLQRAKRAAAGAQ